MLVTGRGCDLARADLVGRRVPGDHRLGPSAAGRHPDTEDLEQPLFLVSAIQRGSEAFALGEDLGSELDQLPDLDVLVTPQFGAICRRWRELKGSGPTRAYVTEPLDRACAIRSPSLSRQPGVDQRVPIFVWK